MIYLDNAATTGKKPPAVLKAVQRELMSPANPGRSAHQLSLKSMNKIYETREMLARLFHSEHPENFILTPNATYALNFAIKGVLKKYNSHVIITSMEHNSVIRPVNAINGVSITTVKGDDYGIVSPEEIKKEIRYNTSLIVINHSSNVNGIIQDINTIARIAREKKIPILIDASQSAGIIDINSNNFDMIALPGHKGLYGPQGTGALYISPGISLDTLIEGGTGSDSKNISNPEFFPDRLESGTLNCPGFCGLTEGIRFVLSRGIYEIAGKEKRLLKTMLEGLSVIKGVKIYSPFNLNAISNLISFNINNIDSQTVAEALNSNYNIAVRPGYHCAYPAHCRLGTEKSGSVRASLSYFNEEYEIKKFLYAVNKISNTFSRANPQERILRPQA